MNDKDFTIRSSNACEELLGKTLPAFGPKGANKKYLNELDHHRLDIAPKKLIRAGENQQKKFGDGVNLLISIAVKHLQGAKELITKNGMTTNQVVRAYEKASNKVGEILEGLVKEGSDNMDFMNKEEVILRMKARVYDDDHQKFLCPLIAEACIAVHERNPTNSNIDTNVRVGRLLGRQLCQSQTLRGMVLKAETIVGSIKSIEKTKVVVITGTETVLTEQLENDATTKKAKGLIKAVAKLGARVIVSETPVGARALDFCELNKIMVLQIGSRSEIGCFCSTTNARHRLIERTGCYLGEVDSIKLEKYGGDRVTIRHENGGVSTVLVGGKADVSYEERRAVYMGVNAFKALCKDSRIVPGAGASEIEISRKLKEYSVNETRSDKLAIEKYAESFELIPKTLAESASIDDVDAEDIVSHLYMNHASGNVKVGIDLLGGRQDDCNDAIIWDLYTTKDQALKDATDAVCNILEYFERANVFKDINAACIEKRRSCAERNFKIARELDHIMNHDEHLINQKSMWLAILKDKDTIFALSRDGKLYAVKSSTKLCWSTNVGDSLHLTKERLEAWSYENVLSWLWMYTDTPPLERPGTLLVGHNCENKSGQFEMKFEEKQIFINLQTGDEVSTTDCPYNEVLCLRRLDRELKLEEDGRVLAYKRIALFNLYILCSDGLRWHQKSEELRKKKSALLKEPLALPSPGACYECLDFGGTVKDKFGNTLVEVPADFKPFDLINLPKTAECDDVAVAKMLESLRILTPLNVNLLTVFGGFPLKGLHIVFREKWGMPLSMFPIDTFKDNTKSLRIIWGILSGFKSLHGQQLYIGTLTTDDIHVNNGFLVKIAPISDRTRLPMKQSRNRKSLYKAPKVATARDDLRAAGAILFYCLTGVIYDKKQHMLWKPKPVAPVDTIAKDTLDLLKQLVTESRDGDAYTAIEAQKHDAFWTPGKSMGFIEKVVERSTDTIRNAIIGLETNLFAGKTNGWQSVFDKKFLDLMKNGRYTHEGQGGPKEYRVMKIFDLFIIIRNAITHEKDIRQDVAKNHSKEKVLTDMLKGDFVSWIYDRVLSEFPTLFNESWKVLKSHVQNDSIWGDYY